MQKKSKASAEDIFMTLSTVVYKSGLEIIFELEEKGRRAGHFRGIIYRYLSEWEQEGYVSHRIREIDITGLPYKEWIRTSGSSSPFEKYAVDLVLQS